MAHLHSVYDTDNHFIIDPVTRGIDNQSGKIKLMQGDHNSERFTFEIPKLIDGHDMTLCDSVEIHYINIDASTRQTSADVYTADDVQTSPDSDDVVIFSWLLSKNSTMYAGTLNFRMSFKCHGSDSSVDYAWHTEIYKGINVSDGINNTEAVYNEYSDILAAWKSEIDGNMSDIDKRVKQNTDDIGELKSEIGNLVSKNQGTENSGKALVIDENGNVVCGEAGVSVDKTLSEDGKAADAKTTGDKISELKGDIANLESANSALIDDFSLVVSYTESGGFRSTINAGNAFYLIPNNGLFLRSFTPDFGVETGKYKYALFTIDSIAVGNTANIGAFREKNIGESIPFGKVADGKTGIVFYGDVSPMCRSGAENNKLSLIKCGQLTIATGNIIQDYPNIIANGSYNLISSWITKERFENVEKSIADSAEISDSILYGYTDVTDELIWKQGYWNYTTGKFTNIASATYQCCEKIIVKSGEKFRATLTNNSNAALYCLYDSHGKLLSSVYDTTLVNAEILIEQDGFIAFGSKISIQYKIEKLRKSLRDTVLLYAGNYLYGKFLAITGDSEAAGHQISKDEAYGKHIADRNGMILQNYAIGGRKLCSGTDTSLCETYTEIDSNADFIIVHIGYNDTFDSSVDDSSTDKTTFKGAFNVLLTGLQANYPDARILVNLPYYFNRSQQNIDRAEWMARRCEYYHIQWFDGCKNSGLNIDCAEMSKYFIDAVHLTAIGHRRMSYIYENALRNI